MQFYQFISLSSVSGQLYWTLRVTALTSTGLQNKKSLHHFPTHTERN